MLAEQTTRDLMIIRLIATLKREHHELIGLVSTCRFTCASSNKVGLSFYRRLSDPLGVRKISSVVRDQTRVSHHLNSQVMLSNIRRSASIEMLKR